MTHSTRRALSTVFGVLTALGLLTTESPALAQAGCERTKPGEHCYTFDDDLLSSDVGWADIPIIRGPTQGRRVLLIRPRASFVPEMLKSVEHI